jgi:hypothetical protein
MTESKKRSSKAAGRGSSRAAASRSRNAEGRNFGPAGSKAAEREAGSKLTNTKGPARAAASSDVLVRKFAESAIGQTDALENGDAVSGEKHAVACSKTFDALRAQGDSGREALTALFEHEDAAVRTTAAVFLLGYCEERALAVLEAEAKGDGLPAFVAAQALERWEEGDWDLDPE